MVPIGLGFAMSSYEAAFSSAVQMDEANSRKHYPLLHFAVALRVRSAFDCTLAGVGRFGSYMYGLWHEPGFNGVAHPPP